MADLFKTYLLFNRRFEADTFITDQFIMHHVHKKKSIRHEHCLLERSQVGTWSVMNMVSFEWSTMSGL